MEKEKEIATFDPNTDPNIITRVNCKICGNSFELTKRTYSVIIRNVTHYICRGCVHDIAIKQFKKVLLNSKE